jgi:cell division protein FtsI/penicillin-binding protein 2
VLKARVARPEAVAQIVAALKLVCQPGGTATKAAVDGYEVAGKTGTSQKWVDGQYSSSRYVASFVGFVPADDPAFVLLVAADEPSKGGYYGGTVAAPSFSRIAEQTLRHLQIAPAKPGTRPLAGRLGADAEPTVYEPLPFEPLP